MAGADADPPRLMVTPHNSGSTDGAGRRAHDICCENLRRRVAGEDPLDRR